MLLISQRPSSGGGQNSPGGDHLNLDESSRRLSCLKAGSITHGSELSFMEFLDLFKSFR